MQLAERIASSVSRATWQECAFRQVLAELLENEYDDDLGNDPGQESIGER